MKSIRERILEAIESRLAVVRTANGFRTDIGGNVFFATRFSDARDELPAVSVWPEPETAEKWFDDHETSMTVGIEGMILLGSDDHPGRVAEMILPDIIDAMTATQWTYEFDSGTAEPVVGSEITGDLTGYTATLQAVTVMSGSWADGDAAGVLTLRGHHHPFFSQSVSTEALLSFAAVDAESRIGTAAVTLVSDGLAEEILYAEGGPESWAEAGDSVSASRANFTIRYRVRRGDPYRQMS